MVGRGWGSGVGLLTSFFFVLHDLRSDRFFYFVARTSCYLGYVFSTSLHALHVTLDTSCLGGWGGGSWWVYWVKLTMNLTSNIP